MYKRQPVTDTKLPAGAAVQADWPESVWRVPDGQSVAVVAPVAGTNVPGVDGRQTDWPEVALKEPGLHCVGADAPVVLTNVRPGGVRSATLTPAASLGPVFVTTTV